MFLDTMSDYWSVMNRWHCDVVIISCMQRVKCTQYAGMGASDFVWTEVCCFCCFCFLFFLFFVISNLFLLSNHSVYNCIYVLFTNMITYFMHEQYQIVYISFFSLIHYSCDILKMLIFFRILHSMFICYLVDRT